jgi:endonuclease-8
VPEGDTIHRAASTLAAALQGAAITSFELARHRGPGRSGPGRNRVPAPGERVDAVAARGKHLLIECSGGLTLHTHMRMRGSWHVYRPGERWRRGRNEMVAAVGVEGADAVCFSAPVVELLDAAELRRHPVLSALGPDLCVDGADLDEAVRRLGSLDPATAIGVALLDQTVAAGIGNVYRAEVAWACRIDPFTPVGELGGTTRRELFATASRLLRSNLGSWRRSTVPGGLAVYDRAGRACPRCGAAIVTRRQGEQARSVWWCPGCQR